MKKILKYGVFPIAVFGFLAIVTVMLMPVLINVQRFVPEIEEKIREVTGRSFSIGPDLGLSFFPWLSISFSGMKLGNPPGFISDEFVKIDSFEARIRLLPLLKKKIEISRFVVGGLDVNLEKNNDGKINWEFVRTIISRESSAMRSAQPWRGFLQGNVSCDLLAVTDGKVNWVDRSKDIRHSVADLMILLNDVTVDRPIALDLKASYDGKPIALEGKIGPLRQKQGNEPLSVDIGFGLVDTLRGRVQGKVENWRLLPVYNVSLHVASFSPRALLATLGIPFPVATADPDTFQTLALDVVAKGSRDGLAIDKGTAQLDATGLAFSVQAKSIQQLDLEFFLEIDRLDLDRYLPTVVEGKSEVSGTDPGHPVSRDYRPLGYVSLAGGLKMQSLKIHGTTVTNVDAHFGGKDGIFTLDRSSMTLYGGQLQANLTADLLGELPKMRIALQSQDVQVAPMLRDFGGKEILSGTLASDIAMEFSGDTVVAMRKTLSGEAAVTCRDGALPGVDLLEAMQKEAMQNRKSVDAAPPGDHIAPRTDFSELKSAVAVNNGLVEFGETTLTTPDAVLLIGGTADLAGQRWDLQVAPMQANKAQGDHARPPMVLTVTGTFATPELKVDNRKQAVMVAAAAKKTNVGKLVDEKIPSPVDDDVKNLVGKALIDPAIVAQRFHLQPETIKRNEVKKQLRVGSGKIRIGPLQEESSVR
ncbi:MAG: AsmA [uncultured bacterium]|nr:MAG: AsmA [uncultured bacterium]